MQGIAWLIMPVKVAMLYKNVFTRQVIAKHSTTAYQDLVQGRLNTATTANITYGER